MSLVPPIHPSHCRFLGCASKTIRQGLASDHHTVDAPCTCAPCEVWLLDDPLPLADWHGIAEGVVRREGPAARETTLRTLEHVRNHRKRTVNAL